ncbi:MAG: DUF5060 domain-containing protein [Bacteroidota bacterium]|nr:DUF5060 domain-containing protein [Bacteroidota bacterium]
MKRFGIMIFLLFLTVHIIDAQIKGVTFCKGKTFQYKKAEWDIRLVANWANPYLQEEITLDMLITSPTGKKQTLPCYFETGISGKESVWKARFAPQETGHYKYYFRLNKYGKTVSVTKFQSFYSKPTDKNGFIHLKNNWAFQFDNGKPFRAIGENIAWESRDFDDSKYFKKLHENPKYNYNYMLSSLASNGGNFYRTWICRWNLPLDWKNGFNNKRYRVSDGYFNPSAVARMDSMINLADSLGLYIMLTFGPGAYSIKDGGFSPSAEDFFVNPKSKTRYKNRLRYIVARWGYSTSVAAWELFNEIDNVQYSENGKVISADSIVKWHDEMSTYLKQQDPYGHLVTTSISHRDLKGLNSLSCIDFNQKHIYKNTSSIPSQIVKYEKDFGKPYVIGEFGYEWDWSKNFDEFAEEMDYDFKRGLWYGLFSPTPILPMTWWWEFFDHRNMTPYLRSVREISDQMLDAGHGDFQIVPVEANDVESYGLKCGDKLFVYLLNNNSVISKSNLSIEGINKLYKISGYIPSKREYKDLGTSSLTGLTLKDIILNPKSEIVLIFTPIL